MKKLGEQEAEGENATQTNLAAFIPFSYGPENCAGRALALAELRIVTALMMHHFQVRFADGYDKNNWHLDLKDWYVFSVGAVPVQLELRVPVLD